MKMDWKKELSLSSITQDNDLLLDRIMEIANSSVRMIAGVRSVVVSKSDAEKFDEFAKCNKNSRNFEKLKHSYARTTFGASSSLRFHGVLMGVVVYGK